jgi:hypothetical protein
VRKNLRLPFSIIFLADFTFYKSKTQAVHNGLEISIKYSSFFVGRDL